MIYKYNNKNRILKLFIYLYIKFTIYSIVEYSSNNIISIK